MSNAGKKMIDLNQIKTIVDNLNELLEKPIPQYAKATICTTIESLLMEVDAYAGFNNVYWRSGGCHMWELAQDDGTADVSKKNEYIIGPDGAKDTDFRSNFTSADQGEYARYYYTGKLRKSS